MRSLRIANNWREAVKGDPELTENEKERFLDLIEKSGIPYVEEYLDEKINGQFLEDEEIDKLEEEYWDEYDDKTREIRNIAIEEAGDE